MTAVRPGRPVPSTRTLALQSRLPQAVRLPQEPRVSAAARFVDEAPGRHRPSVLLRSSTRRRQADRREARSTPERRTEPRTLSTSMRSTTSHGKSRWRMEALRIARFACLTRLAGGTSLISTERLRVQSTKRSTMAIDVLRNFLDALEFRASHPQAHAIQCHGERGPHIRGDGDPEIDEAERRQHQRH